MPYEFAELNRYDMSNKKIIQFLNSFLVFPVIMMIPVSNIPNNTIITEKDTVFEQLNKGAEDLLVFNPTIDNEAKILEKKASLIDSYFKSKNMPLEGMGEKMVIEAEKNNLDWRLIAAISIRESTGGKFACKKVKFNPFGWGSCRIGFNSYEEAIEKLAWNLGGNNPNTKRHYHDKETYKLLQAYNPPSIVPKYAEQVIKIMDTIGPKDVSLE